MEEIDDKSRKLKAALAEYMDYQNDNMKEGRDIGRIMVENERESEANQDIYLNKEMLEQLKTKGKEVTLYL